MTGRVLRHLSLVALAVGAVAATSGAQARQYPTQDIHLICAFPAGSGSDTIVRYVAERIRPLAGRR